MWRPITIDDVRLSDAEKKMLQNIQGATDFGTTVLLNVVREFDAAGRSGGYSTPGDDTVADLCRQHVINRTRWMWLMEFPTLKAFQTPEREKLNKAADDFLENVNSGKQGIDAVNGTVAAPAASWNSENKLVPRTHPVPRPATQFQTQGNDYANPDGPADQNVDA